MVLAQFAHDLFGRGEFGVRISENNWDGIKIAEIGRFGQIGDPEELLSNFQEGCEVEESVPPSSSSVFSFQPE